MRVRPIHLKSRGPDLTRRAFLEACAAAGFTLSSSPWARALSSQEHSAAILRLETDPHRAAVSFLSWDTEGGDRANTNLLRSPGIGVRLRTESVWLSGADLPAQVQIGPGRTQYRFDAGSQGALLWEIVAAKDTFAMTLSTEGRLALPQGSVELFVPFDLQFTSPTVLPSDCGSNGRVRAPMVISAPDFGQMFMDGPALLTGRFEGNISPVRLCNLILEIPALSEGRNCALNFTPLLLPAPDGLGDESLWRLARRGWFNAFQPAAAVGKPNVHHKNATPCILTSKDVDGPCSFAQYFYADMMLWTPEIGRGISAAKLVRRSIEFLLDQRTLLTSEVIGYTDQTRFLDSNPSILICAWDYVEATGDLTWLEGRIAQLEAVANFTALQDQDGDGMVEASQSGNANTLWSNTRSSNWFDAVNFGHKDGYSNALIYRGWLCLADLEAQLHRTPQRAKWIQLAQRLKASYQRSLFNPDTGLLACWRSADGRLHDYSSPVVNGIAIEYGLIGREQAARIVQKLWAKIDAVGFTRFDLGIPTTLDPVHRSDYLQPGAFGIPTREDGTDTFHRYQNGGIFAGFSSPFMLANYRLGNGSRADQLLNAMLKRQQAGGFQNGVHDHYPTGGEWTTWDGEPCGYEGYLADTYFFLRAVLLREPRFRQRYYRPLLAQ